MKIMANVQYLNVVVKDNLTFVRSVFMIFWVFYDFGAGRVCDYQNGISEKGVFCSWNVIVKEI